MKNQQQLISKQGIEIILEILNRYSIKNDNVSLEDFLLQILTQSNVFQSEAEAKTVIEDVFKTVDDINAGYKEIQDYKSRGLSSAIWLRDKIDRAVNHLPQSEQDAVIDATKKAMNNGNCELLKLSKKLTDEEQPTQLVPVLDSNSFRELNKTAIVQNFKEEITLNTMLGNINSKGLTLEINSNYKEIKAVKDYFEGQLDSNADIIFKKVVATGVEIARRKDFLSKSVAKKSTTEITVMVDRAVTTEKIDYQVGRGLIDTNTAIDYLTDRNTSIVGVAIIETCQQVGANVGEAIGRTIGSLIGPISSEFGAFVGRTVGYAGGRAVGQFINRGIEKIANTANTFVEKAKSLYEKGKEKLKSWLFG
jgi:hypothetical protein